MAEMLLNRFYRKIGGALKFLIRRDPPVIQL